jgi:hypothetical protein
MGTKDQTVGRYMMELDRELELTSKPLATRSRIRQALRDLYSEVSDDPIFPPFEKPHTEIKVTRTVRTEMSPRTAGLAVLHFLRDHCLPSERIEFRGARQRSDEVVIRLDMQGELYSLDEVDRVIVELQETTSE